MTKDEALKLALEALNEWGKGFPDLVGDLDKQAISAIKEALAQEPLEQKPLSELEKDAVNLLFALHDAWPYVHGHCTIESNRKAIQALIVKHGEFADIHTSPPQRKPMTDEEIDRLWEMWLTQKYGSVTKAEGHVFARAIEAAHGIIAATQLKE